MNNQNPPTTLVSLVEALRQDPFYAAITEDFADDEDVRRRTLALYFDYSMSEGRRSGRCVLAPDAALGAAIWLWPAEPEICAAAAQAKAASLADILGPGGVGNYHHIVEFMGPRADAVVDPSAWYLSIVGVSPAAQGKGIGAQLLEPTLADADRAGVPAYLETFSRRSLRFYERLGFSPLASHVEPVTGSEYVIMQRGCSQHAA